LRLYDRFDVIANHRVVAGGVLLIGCALSTGFGTGLAGFLAAQGLAYIAQHAYLQLAGWGVFRRHHPDARLAGSVFADRRRRFPGLGRFLLITYWQGNLDVFPKHLVVLGTGAVLDEAAAGICRLAAQTTRVVSVPALLLRQVLFPDLARLWRERDPAFATVVRRTLAIAVGTGIGVALLTLLLGDWVILMVAGEGYLAAVAVLFWLMLSAGLDMGVSAVRSAAYAMDMAGRVLVFYLWSLALYGGLFLWLTPWLGIQGAGMAAAAGSLFTLVSVAVRIRLAIADSTNT